MMVFSVGSFFLALLVFLKRQDSIGRAYFIFNIFVSLWACFHAVEISQNSTYDLALLCGRLGQAVAVFVVPTWLHLTLVINESVERHKKILIASYAISGFIVLFTFTPWFIPKVAPTREFLYYHRRGPVYDIFTVIYFIFVPMGLFQLRAKIKRSLKEEAVQIRGLFIATAIGFTAGAFAYFPIYDIMVPQYNLIVLPIYPFIITYFMIRHKLFDIEAIAQAFQREKLATIGLLASSINHEIRNPLYAARGILENFKEGVSRKPVEEITDKALNQITRALDVITKLNRFAKPANNEPSSTSHASIPEALQNVLDLVSYEFELDKIHIQNDLPNDLPPIQADQHQLEEILFNLIVNACHAIKERQGVRDKGEGGILEIRSTQHAERITIEITDSGTGISQEHLKHLFEPFHTTKGDKGTGLGLYITKQLVERNAGKVSVNSKEGQGTKFVLKFKIAS